MRQDEGGGGNRGEGDPGPGRKTRGEIERDQNCASG